MITKSKFKFFDKEIEVSPITVWQYDRILKWDKTVYLEIFWETWILMCKRQMQNALKILLGWYEENELKNLFKSNKIVKTGETVDLKHFFILESKVMMILHQQRSEIRKWEFLYFMDVYNNLDVIVGEKSYDDFKNAEKPDKKGFKDVKNLLDNQK